jgi:hypothetical protein
MNAVPLKLSLELAAPRPLSSPDQIGTVLNITGQLEYEQVNIGSIVVNASSEGHNYDIYLPLRVRPTLEYFRLRFIASDWYQPGNQDIRALSVIFYRVSLEPDISRFGIEGWIYSFWKPFLFVLMAFSIRGIVLTIYRNKRTATYAQIAGGLVLIASLWLWSVEFEPYYAAWGFILSSTWVLVGLASLFNNRAPGIPAPFVYAATLLPLMPLSQFAFLRLNLSTLNPSTVTFGVFSGALLYSGAIYVSRNIWINQPPDEKPIQNNFERAFVRSVLFASVVSFIYNLFYQIQTDPFRGVEFRTYYSALLGYEAGRPLYEPDKLLNRPLFYPNAPPLFGPFFWPLARIFGDNSQVALQSWRAFCGLAIVAAIFLLLRTYTNGNHKSSRYLPLVLFATLNFGQIADSIGYGQFSPIVLLCLTYLGYTLKRGTGASFGVTIALASGLKLYPAGWFLFLWIKEHRRALPGFIAGVAGLGLLCLVTVGWNSLGIYFSEVIPALMRPEMDITNQSLFGMLARLDVAQVLAGNSIADSIWVIVTGTVLVLVILFLTFRAIYLNRQNPTRSMLIFAVLVMGFLLIPPLVAMSEVVVALPAVIALMVSYTDYETPRWQLFLFGLFFAWLGYGSRFDFFGSEAVGLARIGASYRFFALAGLWLLALWQLEKLKSGKLTPENSSDPQC